MSLLLSSWSWVRSRKGGSVWIASSCLGGRHSPNFRTSLVFSRQTGFSECEHSPIDKSIIITEPVVASTRLLGLHGVRKCILATSHVCSTKILLDSCKVRQNSGSERKALLRSDIIITKEQSTFPVSETSPVMATFCLTGLFVASDRSAVMMVQPAEGPSFGVAPYQQTINKERRMK